MRVENYCIGKLADSIAILPVPSKSWSQVLSPYDAFMYADVAVHDSSPAINPWSAL